MAGMEGKIALVTGGGSGLGAAICARLAQDGAVVVVNDIDADAAERTAKELGGGAQAAAFDVSDAQAVDHAIDAIADQHGRIDILVNNAGIAPDRPEVRQRGVANMASRMGGGPVEPTQATSSLSDAEWDRMIRVHLYGTFHCTRAALRRMEQARAGAIVNMASIAGISGLPGAPDYSAAKGGIIAFTKAVAGEVAGLGIRVNAVAPAFIDTPLLDPFDETTKAMLTLRTPIGRLGRAEEVAAAVRFLAGDEAGYSVGEVLTVTGGFN
jgi:3-oxoacyl-[acyl-carrier protein] reductase